MVNLCLLSSNYIVGGSVMRRVVGLIIVCSMVLSTNYISNVEAVASRSQIKKKVKQSSKIQKQKLKTVKKGRRKGKKQPKKVSKKKSKVVAIHSETNHKDDLVVFNEPIIDGSKINESSIVVNKDIKLANNDETTETNVTNVLSQNEETVLDQAVVDKDIKLASNDETTEANATNILSQSEEITLDQIDIPKKAKVVAQIDNSEDIIKEKIQQINNNRKLYDLIRTPKKDMKDNIQVTKFREELKHYRKMYSSKLKRA